MLYVASCAARSGGVVTREELEAFTFEGESIKLIDQSRGIRNPRQLEATLTVLAQPRGPYADSDIEDGRLHYAYRAGPSDAGDNRKLRRAADLGVPLILLRGMIDAGVFLPIAPVYVTRADLTEAYVEISLDEGLRFLPKTIEADQRSYVERVMRERIHQPMFRAEVIRAYEVQCAMCRLRHAELLDAAHILPDRHERGHAVVPNGLALCKIHHAAFDSNLLGIRPDLVVEVRPKVLLEVDGPMLKHGLQANGRHNVDCASVPPTTTRSAAPRGAVRRVPRSGLGACGSRQQERANVGSKSAGPFKVRTGLQGPRPEGQTQPFARTSRMSSPTSSLNNEPISFTKASVSNSM
jgi:putative restriction endonuclease